MPTNSIKIYFPAGQLVPALESTRRLTLVGKSRVCLGLPAGRLLLLPFDSAYSSKHPRELLERTTLESDGSQLLLLGDMRFPKDAAITDYLASEKLVDADSTTRHAGSSVTIGQMYLSIRLGKRFAELAFIASNNRMSELVANSEGIRQQSRQILHEAGGILAVFFDDLTNSHHTLDSPAELIRLNLYDYYDPGQDLLDIDAWADALTSAVGSRRES